MDLEHLKESNLYVVSFQHKWPLIPDIATPISWKLKFLLEKIKLLFFNHS